jgi:hypothetical protein
LPSCLHCQACSARKWNHTCNRISTRNASSRTESSAQQRAPLQDGSRRLIHLKYDTEST